MSKGKELFDKNKDKIAKCLNIDVILPYFCEKGLFTVEDEIFEPNISEHEKKNRLFYKISNDSESYSKFVDCLREEQQHLGHAYIRSLLDGRQYLSEEGMANSEAIKAAINSKMSDFTKGINLGALYPHLIECQLLTEDEGRSIYDTCVPATQRILFLIHLLHKKGPLGYSLFANCLQNERSHCTHNELYATIYRLSRKRMCKESSSAPPCKMFSQLRLTGPLEGKEYEQMMATFQTYHHNGEWTRLEAVATEYLEKKHISCELQITALLEKSISLFFGGEMIASSNLILQAKKRCEHISGDNCFLLDGRCEYVLSRMYRYKKEYEKAKKHAENARKILHAAKPGEDSAFACYCYACVLVDSDPSIITEVETHFKAAIDHARSHCSGLDLVEPHSYMRLAQLYLGSTQYMAGNVVDEGKIHDAENCLKNVDPNPLPLRSRCHFRLTQSDLYRSKGMLLEAREAVDYVLKEAERHCFTNEIESARNRLVSL